MAEDINILADKNVKKQEFDTKLFYLNLKKTYEGLSGSFCLFESYIRHYFTSV